MEDVEGCSLEDGNIGKFQGAVRVVMAPAEAIACVDAALFFHIRQTPQVAT